MNSTAVYWSQYSLVRPGGEMVAPYSLTPQVYQLISDLRGGTGETELWGWCTWSASSVVSL